MKKFLLIIIICFITLLSTSCSKDYKEIPKSEFTETILPSEKIEKVVVENGEYLIIYTSEKIPYKIVSISNYEINPLVEEIQSNNKNVDISYEQRINISSWLLIWQLLNLLIPILIISHIILICIALRKIIKSTANDLEKILYAIISIFVPFFGPIIYLTTKPKS